MYQRCAATINSTKHEIEVKTIFAWRSACPVAYAENFHGGFHSGTWWSFVFGVRSLWRHNLTSYSCFQTNLLAKFV